MDDLLTTPKLLELVAERFKVLSEPTRLQILSTLREGEHTVSELVDATGCGQANVSKHLQILHSAGFVVRRREGLYVHYRLEGDEVFQLCDIMCGVLTDEARAREAILGGEG